MPKRKRVHQSVEENGAEERSIPIPAAPLTWVTQDDIRDILIGGVEEASKIKRSDGSGCTAADFAEALGLSAGWLSAIIRGNGRAGAKTAAALDMELVKFGRSRRAHNNHRPR